LFGAIHLPENNMGIRSIPENLTDFDVITEGIGVEYNNKRGGS
jgi:hypothetical protein